MPRLLIGALVLLLTLAACERFQEESTAPPKNAPVTITPTVVETPTQKPSASPTPRPSPIPRPSAIPKPSPTSRPKLSPTQAPARVLPGPSEPTIPISFETYEDGVFGFQLRYPSDWLATDVSSPPVLAQIGGTEEGSPQARISLFYRANILAPDAVVDGLIPLILDQPGFRVLAEEELTLVDGTPAFMETYEFRGTEGMRQGNLFGVVRDTQNFVIMTEADQNVYQERANDIQALLFSFDLIEPAPMGIDRDEALTLFFDEGPLILDPAIAQESQSIQYIAQIFSGLVAFDGDLSLVTELAKEWRVSDDGTVYTFTLQDNAMFHSGRAVTASDVKYSWERAADPANYSPTVKIYLNDIVGMQQIFDGQALEASGLEVVDQRTLRVTIDAPKAYFLSKLAHAVAFVVDQANVALGPFWWAQPSGTGPFKLKFWDNATLLILEANQDYYGMPPQIPFVLFRLYGGSPLLMYESGEIDTAFLSADDMARIADPQDPLSSQARVNPELSIFYVGMSSDQPPFDDPLVRKAFLIALDRGKLVRDIYEGSREIAHGFLPPGLPGHDPLTPPIAFDPEEARRLLAASSYGGPEALPPIVYTTQGTPRPGSLVIALADMWNESLGVEIQVSSLDPGTYFYNLETERGNLFDYGWIADYPDPHNFLDVLFHSGGENNVGGYNNDQVNQLLEKARLEQDTQRRLNLYRQVEKLIIEDAAAIPLNFGRSHLVTKPYVKDLALTPFGQIDLRRVSLLPR